MRRCLLVILMLFSWEAYSAQCTEVFTNGAASTSASGKIKFEKGARIFGTSGVLDFAEIDDQSKGTSCNTHNYCALSGAVSASLNIPTFKNHTTSNKIKISKNGSGSASAGDYEEITLEQGVSFQFTSANSEYIIKSFKAGKNAVIVMAPGDYWIEEFLLEQGVGVTFSSSGTVRLYANKVTLNKNATLNQGGGADRLAIVAYDQVKLEQGSRVEGFVYAQTSFKAEKNTRIIGAVNSAEVVLGQDVELTYQQSSIVSTEFENLCATEQLTVHHYRVQHDGSGLTCEAESMVIKACANADCSQVYDQQASVTVQPFAQNVTIPASSVGQPFNVAYTTQGTSAVSITGASPGGENSLVCVDDISVVGSGGKSCNITFSNAAFQLFGATVGASLPNQIAEQKFANVNVRAVRDNNGVCVAALQGNQRVDMTFSCTQPASCIVDLDYDLDPNDGFVDQAFSQGVQAPLDLVFNNQGIAPLDQLMYRDAGRISLAIEGVINGATVTSGSALVNVVPHRLTLSEDTDTTSYDAGDLFNISVYALGANNGILQNYQPGALQFSAARIGRTASGYVDGALVSSTLGQPIPGQLTAMYSSTNNPSFSGGSLTFSAYYTEVDTIQLGVRDNDYLQAGIAVYGANSVTLGPFLPAYFGLSVANQGSINFVNTYTTATHFSYLGRDIGLSADILIDIEARNAQNDITQNYQTNNAEDDWNWLPVANPPTGISFTQTDQIISVFNRGTAATSDITENNVVQLGQKRLTISGIRVVYAKDKQQMLAATDVLTSVHAPFAASATITLDATLFDDSTAPVCYNPGYDINDNDTKTECQGLSFGPITGAELRWGRLVIDNAFGPETEDKLAPVKTEYWTGTEFVLNGDDSVNTVFLANSLTFTEIHPGNGQEDITDNVTVANRNIEVTAGRTTPFEGIFITKPDDGSRGSLIIQLEPVNDINTITWDDYLQFDWNGLEAGIGKPSAEVTFGQFRGNDRIIHWREVFN